MVNFGGKALKRARIESQKFIKSIKLCFRRLKYMKFMMSCPYGRFVHGSKNTRVLAPLF